MKILQRREKNTASTTSVLSERVVSYQNTLRARWQALSPRDQLALGILLIFLFLFLGGYGGYSVHQASKESKSEYQEQVADYFWLRAQSGNIDSNALNATSSQNGAEAMPPASQINAILNASGINDAQVIATSDTIQLSFSNGSQAVASAALGRLSQQGWQFTQLSMQQDIVTKQIQVQATVGS